MRLFLGLICGLVATNAYAHDPRPVGDGRISSTPQQGFVYSCQQRFNPNAPGAHSGGNWTRSGIFYPAEKVTVDGRVLWPDHALTIRRDGSFRVLSANNLPNRPTGTFPISRTDDAYRYDRNPNRIRAQNILLRLPAEPELAGSPSCVPMGMIGFTLTGGALFNALDARGNDAAAHEILDACGGHPEQRGQYHYHDLSKCFPAGADADGHGPLVGYALDGFGIFGAAERGETLNSADLDACHGHVGLVTWDGEPREMFHYHMTADYPYSVGCFRGTPVAAARGSQNNPTPNARPRQRGGDPIFAIARELGVDPNRLRRAVGPPPPNIDRAARELGIDRNRLRQLFEQYRPR